MPLFAVVLAVIVVLAVVLVFFGGDLTAPPKPAAGSPAPSTDQAIQVLPSPGTQPGCVNGQPGQYPGPSLPLDNGTLYGATYDIPTGTTGQDGLCYEPNGGMEGYVNWTHVGGTGTAWFSYPQLTYGVMLWSANPTTYTPESSLWSAPTPVSTVVANDLWITTNYSFHMPAPSDAPNYDYSLDDFFTEQQTPHYQPGNSDPFVEVMVWFAHHVSNPSHFLSWATPTLLNQTVSEEPWSVGYYCHGTDNSTNANMSFDFSFEGQQTRGLASGTVGVNLSAVLAEAEALMPSVSCWTGPTQDFSSFYWDDTNMGSEDAAEGGSSFTYNWEVYGYCFHLRVDLADWNTLSCPSTLSSSLAPPSAGNLFEAKGLVGPAQLAPARGDLPLGERRARRTGPQKIDDVPSGSTP